MQRQNTFFLFKTYVVYFDITIAWAAVRTRCEEKQHLEIWTRKAIQIKAEDLLHYFKANSIKNSLDMKNKKPDIQHSRLIEMEKKGLDHHRRNLVSIHGSAASSYI